MQDKTNKIAKIKFAVLYSLKARMLASFALLLAISLLTFVLTHIYGVPFTDFKGELKESEIASFKNLNFVADLKKELLTRWIEERKANSTIFAKSIAVRELITEVMVILDERRSEGYEGMELWELLKNTDAHIKLTSLLDLTARTYGVYEEIELAEPDTGLVFASTIHDELGEDVTGMAYFEGINSSEEIFVHFAKEEPRFKTHQIGYALHFSRFISLVGLERKAVLIMHVDPADFIEPMLHTGDGLGKTGEALLVDSDVRILASLKHALSNGINAEPLVYKIKAKPAVLAAQGEDGIISARDYRTVQVLAAYRHIKISPDTGWGLVVKEDRSEILSSLRENVAYSSAIGFFIILASLGIIYIIARRLTHPINSLSNAARKIAGGNFEARADIVASGEVLALIETFNSMAAKIQNWHEELENEIELRTHELFMENEERKKAESALIEREFWLRESQRTAQIGTYDLNIPTGKWTCTKVLDEIFGIDELYEKTIDGWIGIIHPDEKEEMLSYLQDIITGKVKFNKDYRIIRASDKVERWVHGRGKLMFDDNAQPLRMLGTIQDITSRKIAEQKIYNSLNEKEILLGEVHHRVKNNMAVISSLLSLQSKYVTDKKYLDMINESRNRIKSMALVHEKLYLSDDFAHIDVQDYVKTLAENARSSFNTLGRDVTLNFDVDDVSLNLDTLVPCGLLMNELLTNAFKHAFDGKDTPEINVSLTRLEGGNFSMIISDNGIGLPEGYDISEHAGLGHKLLEALLAQIEGTMEVNVNNGTEFKIVFPEQLEIATAD